MSTPTHSLAARALALLLSACATLSPGGARAEQQNPPPASRAADASERAASRARSVVTLAAADAAFRANELPVEAARELIDLARQRAFGSELAELSVGPVRLICQAPSCQDRLETLERLTGLTSGAPFVLDQVQRASERLFKTGLFESIDVQTSIEEDGRVGLTFELAGAVSIERVRFEGLSPPPFREDFQRLLIYREGQPFRALRDGERRVTWRFGDEGELVIEGESKEPARSRRRTRRRPRASPRSESASRRSSTASRSCSLETATSTPTWP